MEIFKPTIQDQATFSGSVDISGSLNITGNIIPSVSGAYDLGTAELPFRDIYVSQNSLKFISTESGEEIGRISVNKNTGDIKLLNTKRLTPEQRETLTAETADETALSPVSASSLYVSESINPGHTNTSIGHTNQKFHTLHVHFVSASSSTISGSLHVGDTVIASTFTGSFVGDGTQLTGVTSYTDSDTLDYINTVGVISSSAQIASDISGSFTSVSASLASSIAGISTDFTDITNKPTLISGSNQLAGETIEGDLTLTGTLTAQTIHVQQVTSSIVYSSGSNVFGSSAGDVQQFTGSLSITGNVSTLGTLTASGYNSSNWDSAFSWGNHASAGYLTSFTESDPTVGSHIKAITTTKISNWDTAFGWGNHASAGYLTSLPSHNHDDRYYTESESDSRFVNTSGDTITGDLTVNGNFYGRSVNGQYSSIYRIGGIYFTWDSDSYGSNFDHSITSTFGGSYGDNITINSYGHVKINIDSNGNSTSTFSVGRHTTGDANNLLLLDESANMTVYGSTRSPIFYDSNNTAFYVNPASTSNLNAVTVNGNLVTSNLITSATAQVSNFHIRNASPTVFFRDTDHNSAMLHCNSNLFYVLRGGNDTTTWTQVNGQWPGIWNLTNNLYSGGGAATFVGDVTANTSDRRLKENIKNIPNAIDKVKSINGVTFDWKDDLEDINYTRLRIHDVGVIAQEIQAVLPDAVRPAPFDTDEEGNSRSGENYLTVQYEKIVPLLIEAIKEQQIQIEELRKLINYYICNS